MRFFWFVTTYMVVLAAVHLYVSLRVLPVAHLAPRTKALSWLLLGLLWASQLAAPWAYRLFREATPAWVSGLQWLAYGWLGFILLAFFFLLLLEPIRALFAVAGLHNPDRRAFFLGGGSLALLLVPAAAAASGLRSALKRPEVTDVDVPIRDLPPGLQGFTIAQVSDLHLGPTIDGAFLAGVVERVNALGADLIAVTGDLADGTVGMLRDCVAPLAALKAPHGVFFVTGNHEYYWGAREWAAEVGRLGLTVLVNEHRIVERNGAKLLVAGVPDKQAPQFLAAHTPDPTKALDGSPPCDLRMILAHQPAQCRASRAAGFDLQLSGHTHGGQFWPFSILVDWSQPYLKGLHDHDGMWVYVSRGTGYWGPPLRLGVPSEITRLKLVNAPA